ncbi:hypothetical protein TNCV_3821221 [Trichonephila clavipes]|nr:hypothetical protein TNCV_3821221 [Trichonephila clavipes]
MRRDEVVEPPLVFKKGFFRRREESPGWGKLEDEAVTNYCLLATHDVTPHAAFVKNFLKDETMQRIERPEYSAYLYSIGHV